MFKKITYLAALVLPVLALGFGSNRLITYFFSA